MNMTIKYVTTSAKKGFTLIEMLLVLVIASMILILSIGYFQQRTLASRIDLTAAQMQQVMNAGLSYYVASGTWACPTATAASPYSCRVNKLNPYIPLGTLQANPWGTALKDDGSNGPSGYIFSNSSKVMYVIVELPNTMSNLDAVSQILVGKLPVGYLASDYGPMPPTPITNCKTGSSCYVVGVVNVPAQNLNNASAVNFAGLYHNGACVPAPECPVDNKGNTMKAQIIVVPVSVSGINDAPTSIFGTCGPNNLSSCQVTTYPLSSFTAYATGGLDTMPPACASGTVGAAPAACATTAGGGPLPQTKLWRVCLAVKTERGKVNPSTSEWGQLVGTIMVMTRCAITNEPSGSSFNVWFN